jgi:hypothetical protein
MVPFLDVDLQGLPASYSLSERDTDVLSLIDEEDLTVFTFDGLKRRLGLHLKLQPTHNEAPSAPLLQTFLPSDMRTQQLIMELKGKWFGLLRWLGLSENSEGVTLKWITEDGGIQIAASISGITLNIEAKFLSSNNLNLALKAAYQLMTHISRLYTPTPLAGHVAYYGSSRAYPFLAPA